MKKLLMTVVVFALGGSLFASIDVGDWRVSGYNTSDRSATLGKYIGSSASVSIPETISFPVTESYYDEDDGKTKTRTVTRTFRVIGLGSKCFSDNAKLISAEINGTDLNLCSATSLFEGCGNLRKVVFGDGVTALPSSATYIYGYYDGPFIGCTNLEEIAVGTGVSEIPVSFLNANSGSKKPRPGKVSFAGQIVSVGDRSLAVSSVTNLSVSLAVGCTVGGDAFASCPGVNERNVDFSHIASIGTSAFSGCRNIKGGIELPLVTSIGNSAFRNCSGITSIAFSENLTRIGSYALAGSGVVSVRTPNALSSLGNRAFQDCANLVDVEINGSGITLKDATLLFEGCGNLRRAVFSDGVTALPSSNGYYDGPFVGCTNLEEVVVGSGVSLVPRSFLRSNSGNRQPRPGIVSFAGDITTVEDGALPLSSLTNLTISIAQGCVVEGTAFSDCPGVNERNVDFSHIASIGTSAFSGCRNIKGGIELPLVTSIGNSAFRNCSGITSIAFSDDMISIASSSFQGCSNLDVVIFAGPPPSAQSNSFSGTKTGIRGYYATDDSAAWLGVIDAQKMWKGLLMEELPKAVARVVSADILAGSITLGWNAEDYPDGTTFKILRTVGSESLYQVTSGVSAATFTDVGFSKAGWNGMIPCLDTVYYQVEPEFGELPELRSAALETRNRHGIFVGLGKWSTEYQEREGIQLDPLPGADDVERVADIVMSLGRFQSKNIIRRTDSDATLENVTNAFARVADKCVPGDMCLLYFSTHGGILDNGTAVLSLYDSDYDEKQMALDIKSIDSSGREVAVIAIMSACFSGAFFDNPDQSVLRTSWYLKSGLAQCSPNVAWITAASAGNRSYGVFDRILFDYGWRDNWATESEYITFGDLANYTKRQYDSLFSGMVFEDENEEKKIGIQNEVLLTKIVASGSVYHQGKNVPSSVLDVSASTNLSDRIEVSWSDAANVDEYYVFFKYSQVDGYTGYYSITNSQLNFREKKSDRRYSYLVQSSKELPVCFVVKAINGAGVTTATPFESKGWVSGRWSVRFDTLLDTAVVDWTSKKPDLRWQRYVEIELNRGDDLLLDSLPIVECSGYQLLEWKTQSGNKAVSGDRLWDNEVYIARLTRMTDTWIESHPTIFAQPTISIAEAADTIAANGKMTVEQCFLMGVNPEDSKDDFRITEFKMENGDPVFAFNHTEDGAGNSFTSRINILGAKSLGADASWEKMTEVPESEKTDYKFFKAVVEQQQ